jgi:PAS domain-containing protein
MLHRNDTDETWWGNYNFGPIKDDDGRIMGAVVTAREITERKQLEEELRKSRDELQDRVQERTGQLQQAYESLQRDERA